MDGGEVLQNAPQLLWVLRDEAGAEILRMILLQTTQELAEHRQVFGAQRQIVGEVAGAAECLGVGDVDREKGDLASAKLFPQRDKLRQLPIVGAL